MPENTYLYKHLKTEEFLKFNAKFFDFAKEELDKRIDELLEKV
jgi:ABC-type multidrug transport system ATPase subunit